MAGGQVTPSENLICPGARDSHRRRRSRCTCCSPRTSQSGEGQCSVAEQHGSHHPHSLGDGGSDQTRTRSKLVPAADSATAATRSTSALADPIIDRQSRSQPVGQPIEQQSDGFHIRRVSDDLIVTVIRPPTQLSTDFLQVELCCGVFQRRHGPAFTCASAAHPIAFLPDPADDSRHSRRRYFIFEVTLI